MAIDKEALANKIRTLEGLTADDRAALLGLLRQQKRYGLVWEDKPEDVEERMLDELPVLTEVKDRYIKGATEDSPNHILIEGDNLHALTALTYTHAGKIDVIYIDPPYNTGNKDFIYNDSYVDKEDEYRHSKWLSFMSKRLRIAKQLLSDRGVIFISIDDNEQAQLKLLCDEIFGANNFIANLIWQSTPGSNTGEDLKTVTENVLVFSKIRQSQKFQCLEVSNTEKYNLRDEYFPRRGGYVPNKLDRRMTGSHYSDALNYPIGVPDGSIIYPGGKKYKQEHWNWRWSETKLKWGIENDFIFFKKGKNGWSIYFKQYQFVDNTDTLITRSLSYQNLLTGDGLNAAKGTREVMEILGYKGFDYPKPLSLLNLILKMSAFSDSLVLDFFAGSGTTLHATMQLNDDDGGKRQCILVTNNENSICENVTYERNKRVINGYITPKGINVEGLKNNSLHYYHTEFVPRQATMANMRQLMHAATDLLCIKEDLYDEQTTFLGKKWKKDVLRYFAKGDKSMVIVYKEKAIEYIVPILEKEELKSPIKIYVFSPSRDPYSELWDTVREKVVLCALPAAIYDAYKRVLKKPRKKYVDGTKNESTDTIENEPFKEQSLFDNLDEEGGEA